MKSDIEIAQSAKMINVYELAKSLNIEDTHLETYGKYKAKINHKLVENLSDKKDAKLILVTAISPTPAGEGKTTTSIGIADAFKKLGKNSVLALREPSLGPVFGVKGGAAGGGYSQVVPMEDINLHFTGDLHAIGAANNLLAAIIDNHIFHGNALQIDPKRITWKRCVDMNDRQLRFVTNGLGGIVNGTPREDGFDITVASEIMAVFCLATDLQDLKARIACIVVGYTYDKKPVSAGQLNAQGALCALLKDAFNPNLVQTLEHTPAIVHGGPFANIAHGCNSVIATKTAMKLGDYVITEAGFGADLGAEKFFDIKCRLSGLMPSAVVLVATVRALKHQANCPKDKLSEPNLNLLEKGSVNLLRHIDNIKNVFGMKVCVAINAFPTDSKEEHQLLIDICEKQNVPCAVSEVFAKGGEGGVEVVKNLLKLIDEKPDCKLNFSYDVNLNINEKINAICKKVYRAQNVILSKSAQRQIEAIEQNGFANLPVCIAKTQYSFSDDASLLGAPTGFDMTVKTIRLSAGAGFVVAIMGDIMTMPGLPKKPAAESIDVDENGNITGLF